MNIKDFFNGNYLQHEHYWWKNDNRFSIDEAAHTPYYSAILRYAKGIKHGNALDLGAGEGTDAIRLAKLGFCVDAVEISEVGIKKIQLFAAQNCVDICTHCLGVNEFSFLREYDIIMINGVLHYLNETEKADIIAKMRLHTRVGGINCISLFSTYSPTPDCHKIVPVYPDDENGLVESLYSDWEVLFRSYDRNKPEVSHTEMAPHTHSFIKLILRRIY